MSFIYDPLPADVAQAFVQVSPEAAKELYLETARKAGMPDVSSLEEYHPGKTTHLHQFSVGGRFYLSKDRRGHYFLSVY